MSVVAPVLEELNAEVRRLSGEVGRPVDAASLGLTSREGLLPLGLPGRVSANGSCRLFAAKDGWMALNLAREEDRELIPAWLGCELDAPPWTLVDRFAAELRCADLIEAAILLGLPAARVGEAAARGPLALPMGQAGAGPRARLRVVDLSALWAGPMCGAILAAAGASVTRIESAERRDPTALWTPEFFRRLNAGKAIEIVDFGADGRREALWRAVRCADVVITSARPRAFAPLGVDPAQVFEVNPSLVWVAVTAHGWAPPGGLRVGFGDDTAAAGGLVRWMGSGEPMFIGDALSDPLTGLAAAAATLEAVMAGGGVLIDVAMAACAASAAVSCGLRPPA